MAIAIASTMSASANIYLDGLMSDLDLDNYYTDTIDDSDMNLLFKLDGNYYDTLVDTSMNLNTNVLFTAGETITLLTDTGASSIYTTVAAQTAEGVLESIINNGNRDFGLNAQILVGNVSLSNGGSNKVTFTELANGMYESSERTYGGDSMVYSYDDVMGRIDNKLLDESYEETRFGRKIKREWKGITAAEITALNRDQLAADTYTVQAGDGLWAVVHNSGTDLTYEEILDLNPQLKERGLWAGEVLQLDTSSSTTFKEGSLVNIKEWTERDLENKSSKTDLIVEDEYMAAVYADAPRDGTDFEFVGRTVQKGEGLWSSANGLGVSYDQIYAANEGIESRYLVTGEVVYSGNIERVEAAQYANEEKARRDAVAKQIREDAEKARKKKADDDKAIQDAIDDHVRKHREAGEGGIKSETLQGLAIQFNTIELGNLSNTGVQGMGTSSVPLPNFGATIPSFLIKQ